MGLVMVISNWTWLLILCKFTLYLIWLSICEIVHLLLSQINLHALMCWNQSLLMLHIGQILDICIEEVVIINHMWRTVHASWQTLTVEKSQLVISLLNLRNFILIGLMLTVKWAQFTCCVVGHFWNLVWNLIILRIFQILRAFRFCGGSFSTFPRSRRFRCFLRFFTSQLSMWWILKTNLDDTVCKWHLRSTTIRAKISDGKISFTLS